MAPTISFKKSMLLRKIFADNRFFIQFCFLTFSAFCNRHIYKQGSREKITAELQFNSDKGFQYTSHGYRSFVAKTGKKVHFRG